MNENTYTNELKKVIFQRNFGIALFVLGCIPAISSGAKLPPEGATFPDTLVTFFLGTVVGIIGLVIWHMKQKTIIKISLSNTTDGSEHDKIKKNPDMLLRELIPAINQLNDKIDKLDTEEICQEIDVLLDNYVLPFADVRQTIIDLFGMKNGAEILVVVAFGERMLNRVWSAASDGHIPEALNVFPDAVEAFNEAVELLEKFENEK